jgi:transketolase
VLSAGHASMLLYSLLHLFGYGLTIDDLKAFRQWDSLTPGHPEYGHTVGVETTTGPLGQGIATAVGMAMAEAHLAATYNEDGFPIVDHYTYVLAGDGCLMEGVSSEASSLAGHLKLGKLIVLYDSNRITIEGSTELTFTEDVMARYEAYGWHVIEVEDGEDTEQIARALEAAKAETEHPSLIKINTVIGFGSPKAGSAAVHGSPLGAEGIASTLAAFNWPKELKDFEIPAAVTAWYSEQTEKLGRAESEWNDLFDRYRQAYPQQADRYQTAMEGVIPDLSRDAELYSFKNKAATRKQSGRVLNLLAKKIPALFGGSADLAPSNNTELMGFGSFSPEDYTGRNVHYGVREFAMACATNGLALHGGVIPFCATFFVFTDYMKAAMRLSALMGIRVLYIMTHDSIGVGEDGPTHEPVEQLAMLRALPGFTVFRPADGVETAAAYEFALNYQGPTCLALSRQDLPYIESCREGALCGGYVLRDEGEPAVLMMASGSEVALCLEAQAALAKDGIGSRVVSIPSYDVFLRQDQEYIDKVLPPALTARLAVEAGATMPWYRLVGTKGAVLGLDRFGASAPGDLLFEKFGFGADNIERLARKLLS